jgi:molybdenum cofactor biosynthesis enzyme MoaA
MRAKYDGQMALLDVVLGYDCNLACTYCTITQGMRLRALSTERVAKEIDRASSRGFREVAFTGGEPTIRNDLPMLVKYAKRRGFVDVKVASNGLRYAFAPYLRMLADAGVNQFHVSMHAFDDDAYEATVQRAETAVLRRRAIANLVEQNLHPVADLILKEDTYRDVRAWVLALAEQGVKQFRLWLVSLTDGNATNTQQLPRLPVVADRVREALDAARTNALDVRSLHVPRCFLAGYENHVQHPGADLVTVVTPDDVFDLKDSRLSGGVKPAGCTTCKFFDVCPGLRADYIAQHGDGEPRAVRVD